MIKEGRREDRRKEEGWKVAGSVMQDKKEKRRSEDKAEGEG